MVEQDNKMKGILVGPLQKGNMIQILLHKSFFI
jgi:hypothetical protein